ncbi:MAG: response regulator [Synergistaceae bacterium]|nr:response regulator [Synergistaceae bacterium]
MALRVLHINHGATLMTRRLGTLLKEVGIEIVSVEPVIGDIMESEAKGGGASVFLLSAGDFGRDSMDVLAYLKEVCLKTNKPLCVMGYEKDLAEVEKTIPKDLIAMEFTRPLDVGVISGSILSLIDSGFERKKEKSILLVDDDTTFLKMMQSLLGTKYRVAAVSSGAAAMEYILAGHEADLILLDYDMPVMTGPEVLEALRANPALPHIPVIFLTGKNDRDSVVSVMSLKPEGYILKSMGRDDILASLDKFFKA